MSASRFPNAAVSAALFAAGLLPALPAQAALNAFMKIDGVIGDSRDPQHMGWIEIGSVQLDQIRNSLSAGGATSRAGASKIHHNDFSITKTTDKASPKLFEAATKGKLFSTVTIEMRKAGGSQHAFLVFKLENVFVSSYRAASPGGGREESITLNFSDATVEYPSESPRTSAAAHLSAGAATGAVLGVSRTITKVTPSAASATTGQVLAFPVEGAGDCTGSRIDFGDGTIAGFAFTAGRSQPAPTHAYSRGGTFEVRAYGLADPWAKLPAPPPASEHVCSGHALATITITVPRAVAPVVR